MGGPGCGKTFVTNHLLNIPDWKLISVDNYRRNIANKLGYDLTNPEDTEKIMDLVYHTNDPRNNVVKFLKELLKNKRPSKNNPNIVFDAGGSQVEIIKTVLDMAKDAGYKTTLVYIKTNLELALKRNSERDLVIPDKTVVDYYNKCESSFDYMSRYYDNVWVVYNNSPYDYENRDNRAEKVK